MIEDAVQELLSALTADDWKAIEQRAQILQKSLKNRVKAYVTAYLEYMEFAYEYGELVDKGLLLDESDKVKGKSH